MHTNQNGSLKIPYKWVRFAKLAHHDCNTNADTVAWLPTKVRELDIRRVPGRSENMIHWVFHWIEQHDKLYPIASLLLCSLPDSGGQILSMEHTILSCFEEDDAPL